MKYQHPEIFYFLFLLLIPIIVHLFQLQKFIKVPFTNVAFLTKIVSENRKSQTIKKWLILTTRILFLLALLFAFSQPYISNQESLKKRHTFVYLDNSLSMQAIGERGVLLQQAVQELIESAPKNHQFTLLTNNDKLEDLNYEMLKSSLIQLDFTAKKRALEGILLQIQEFQNESSNTLHESILISDFQGVDYPMFTNVTTSFSLIKLKSSTKTNLSIDSLFIESIQANAIDLRIRLNNQGDAITTLPIAIYNKEKLLGKQSFDIRTNELSTVSVTIPKSKQIEGRIKIPFSDTFDFDNQFYFYIDTSPKKHVLNIGKPNVFLSRIYTEEEFIYRAVGLNELDYNTIENQDIIILNELKKLPNPLSKYLLNFVKNGGVLICIPNQESELDSYNNLLSEFNTRILEPSTKRELNITNINFDHPLLKNTFSKKVRNFQYPSIQKRYSIRSPLKSDILNLENNAPFLSELSNNGGKMYLFSGALALENSNFQKSPLIVPIFYNFSKYGLFKRQLYYYLHNENTIDISAKLNNDEVLSLINSNENFIPLQKNYPTKVRLTTDEQPQKTGFSHVLRSGDTISSLAFNYPKTESTMQFLDHTKIQNENINKGDSIKQTLEQLQEKYEVKWLWKWFLGLAIVSLLLEILILKFYKS